MSTQVINTRYEIFETAPGADTAPFVVSKARDLEEGRVVTLQMLPVEALGTPARRQEFQGGGSRGAGVRPRRYLPHL